MTISSDEGGHHPFDVERGRVDLAWERTQEKALNAFRNGRAGEAMASWAKALEIAERHFERGDPRLAASLSNHGFALLRMRQLHQANTCFQRADAAWEDSWRWIPWMTPSDGDEGAEAEPYDRATQDAFYALISRGRTITETLWKERRLADAAGDEWHDVKPKGMSDLRRLFSAVYLMPTARRGQSGTGRRAA